MRRLAAGMLGVLAVGVAAALASGLAGAASDPPATAANAAAIRVQPAGQPTVSGAEVVGPPGASTDVTGFSYPDDGSVVRAGSATGSVAALAGASASAEAVSDAVAVTLFGGDITASSVSTHATAAAGAVTASADTSSSQVQGLVVLGQAIPATTTGVLPLADWGTLEVLVATTTTHTAEKERKSGEASVTGLRVKLTADHGGLAAGSEIDVGVSHAVAVQSPEAKPVATPTPAPKPTKPSSVGRRKAKPIVEPGNSIPGAPPDLVHPLPPGVQAALTSGGYVFPVYGPATFGDSFGAPRPDLVSGWHHGEDIFAPTGTPLLAVADGTVHTVGWNEIGGWRLWLRDGAGNEFYYAHLSAYSPLASEGRHVHAGDVLGFVGSSGDADGGPSHLHFEIHPFGLLSLGYDGVVAPYPFLVAWKRAQDVPFSEGRVYVSAGDGLPRIGAPAPGAVLLQVSDVSRQSGLVPGGMEQTLNGGAAQGRASGP